jgi:NAD(P)-dependent dehydrogenase (short-subunit alcohol dehydrogenase family)
MAKLDGKVAVITGGSSGIGLATAQRFAAEGAHVFITGRRQGELDQAVKLVGKNVTAVQGDVAKLADLDRLYAAVKREKGHVDIVFANAGGGEFVPLGSITEEHFDKTFDMNVKGLLFTVQKALPLLRNGGSIILNASIAGSKGLEAMSVYCASKAAVRSFARTWTVDLKARKIRVNALSPGPIDTPAMNALGKTEAEVDQFKSSMAGAVPLGRIGLPDEIATVALFLASDDSSFVTGIELFVDGGMAQI